MPRPLDTPASVWGETFAAGIRILPRAPRMGLKRLVLPVSYWRTQEFAYVARQLPFSAGARILDVGSPKDLPALLADRRGYDVTATDILPSAISLSLEYSRALGIEGVGPGRVTSEVQDGRHLPYQDASFDAAFAVSVVEHIPDCGDTEAIRELIRVVRPGGRIVVTTPYAPVYYESFVQRGVYERAQKGSEPVFYERHYDEPALASRVLSLPGSRLVDLTLVGEAGLRVERFITANRAIRMALSPLEPLLAMLALKPLPKGRGRPMAAFLTLERVS